MHLRYQENRVIKFDSIIPFFTLITDLYIKEHFKSEDILSFVKDILEKEISNQIASLKQMKFIEQLKLTLQSEDQQAA